MTLIAPLLPSIISIDHMVAERVGLYRHVPSTGQSIPVGVHTFPMEDYIPVYEKISWAVYRLHLNHSGGPSGLRAEHLRQWLHKATWDEVPDATNW